MFHISCLLFFSLFSETVNGFEYESILEVLENNIDDKIDACDDFYRHSCAKKTYSPTMEEYMETGYSSDLKNINQKYIPNSIQYSLAIAQNLQYLKENSTKLYERQLKSLYIQKCESNKAEALKFLKNLQSLFYLEENEPCTLYNCFSNLAMDSNCSRAAETLYKVVVANVKDVFRINDFKLGNFTKAYNNALSTLWLFDHPAEKSELRKMFEFFKNEMLLSMETTPWLKNSKTMEIFKNITSIMYLDFMESEVKTVIEDSLKFQKNYDNCTYKYATLGQLSFDFCVIKNLPEIREIELFEINAFNGHPEIQILNPITALMLPNIPLALKYGYVGATTIGHEMGHTIIPLGLEDGFFPYFSKDVQNCIQNQFNSTCRSFKEESCDVRDDQFDENGADIFGFPFAFDRLKQHLGNRIYEKLPGSRRGLTHAQAYFYAVSNGFCSREDSYSSSDTHGAANARINAGVIQSPEFEKVFNCSKNSRMVQSRKQFCYVLGENAPQN